MLATVFSTALIGEFVKQLQTNKEKHLVVADAGWYSAEMVEQELVQILE